MADLTVVCRSGAVWASKASEGGKEAGGWVLELGTKLLTLVKRTLFMDSLVYPT